MSYLEHFINENILRMVKNVTGNIHSVDSFSSVDGPGIRYVVFMQGCNLRCKFCHNPDTWNEKAGQQITVEKLIDKILRNKEVYLKGGGVTLTGGEPLLQKEFVLELVKILKSKDINVAIDTAGNFDMDEDINDILKYIDLVILDIKEIDSIKHKELTGSINEKILKFGEYVSNTLGIPVWIRTVYMPGITNIDENYISYLKRLKSLKKVEILPYHNMGKYKWEELGYEYMLGNVNTPTVEECNNICIEINKKINL